MNDIIFYRGVNAIPINSDGQILLQLRDDRPDLNYPNCWTTLGGAVEAGETFDQAIRRELLEEIEIDLPVNLWKIQRYETEIKGQKYSVEAYVYVGRIDLPVSEIKLNEGQALGYFGEEDLGSLQIGFGYEVLFREFFRALESGELSL
jgi:8-oxo-dGTP diphosphatase